MHTNLEEAMAFLISEGFKIEIIPVMQGTRVTVEINRPDKCYSTALPGWKLEDALAGIITKANDIEGLKAPSTEQLQYQAHMENVIEATVAPEWRGPKGSIFQGYKSFDWKGENK